MSYVQNLSRWRKDPCRILTLYPTLSLWRIRMIRSGISKRGILEILDALLLNRGINTVQ